MLCYKELTYTYQLCFWIARTLIGARMPASSSGLASSWLDIVTFNNKIRGAYVKKM